MSKIDDQMVGVFQWIEREQWRQLNLPPGDTVMDGAALEHSVEVFLKLV